MNLQVKGLHQCLQYTQRGPLSQKVSFGARIRLKAHSDQNCDMLFTLFVQVGVNLECAHAQSYLVSIISSLHPDLSGVIQR